jgi:prevent-host-death family protein
MPLNEVKNGLSRVVEEVESGQRIIITKHGHDAVIIKPLRLQRVSARLRYTKKSAQTADLINEMSTSDIKAMLDDIDRLAERIGKDWQGNTSAVDAVREQRRDL